MNFYADDIAWLFYLQKLTETNSSCCKYNLRKNNHVNKSTVCAELSSTVRNCLFCNLIIYVCSTFFLNVIEHSLTCLHNLNLPLTPETRN